MPIIVSEGSGGDFVPAPAGQHAAICCDVVNLGIQPGSAKYPAPKHKVRVCWFLSARMDDGRPFMLSQQYTASLHENANLRADLESWRGRPFTADELKKFDLEKLIGAPALINVIHNVSQSNGNTYANVASIGPLPGAMTNEVPPVPEDFERVQDREGYVPPVMPSSEQPEQPEPTQEDAPF